MRLRLKSGLSLHYRTRGMGRTVVLVHPVGLRAEFWNGVIAELETEYRLIAPDTRGHGESEISSQPFGLDDLAADLIELIGTLGNPPAVLVGCSMGGAIVTAAALRAPELVAGLVTANSTQPTRDRNLSALDARVRQALEGMPTLVDPTLQRWFDQRFMTEKPELVARVRDWLLDADPVVHSWSWRVLRDRDHGDRLGELAMPVLAIAGGKDRSATPAAVRAGLASFRAASYRELPEAGHLAPLEEPAAFAGLLRDFIAGLPPGTAP